MQNTGIKKSVEKPLESSASENWWQHMKLIYANMDIMAQLQHTTNDPQLLDGWAFVDLLCVQEAAVGDGNMNAGRLYQQICAEFPELKSRVGEQFFLSKSSKDIVNKDVVEQLGFLKIAVYASRKIFRKPWPKLPAEEMA